MPQLKTKIMDADGVRRALVRIAHEIVEKNNGVEDVCLVGIRRRGVPIAEALGANIEKIEGRAVPVGSLDITFYRDDLTKISDMPQLQKSALPFSIEKKRVVLVDDVLYTGRTVRAAIEALAIRFSPDDSAQNRSDVIERDWAPLCMLEMEIEHLSGKQAKELARAGQ